MIKPYLWKNLENKNGLNYRKISTTEIADLLYKNQMTKSQKEDFENNNKLLNKAQWVKLLGIKDDVKKSKYNVVAVSRKYMNENMVRFIRYVCKSELFKNEEMRKLIATIIVENEITEDHKNEFNKIVKKIYINN